VSSNNKPIEVFRNDAGTLTPNPVWTSTQQDHTVSLALADVDGDGNLDIAVGNNSQTIRIYQNDSATTLLNDPQSTSYTGNYGENLQYRIIYYELSSGIEFQSCSSCAS